MEKAEIKISDLSIGDWVRDIRKRKKNDDIFGSHSLRLKDIEPIPLTPEILEKNGFEKKDYDNGKMWDWWCDNVLVRKYADEDIYRFIVVFNSLHYTTMMVVVKHTHQLQHALRLAKEGKEIVL